MNKLPKEILVGWFGEKGDQYLSANITPDDVLENNAVAIATCGRYVLKETVEIERYAEVIVKKKGAK